MRSQIRLSKRANKRAFRKAAGYVNARNISGRNLQRGGERKV